MIQVTVVAAFLYKVSEVKTYTLEFDNEPDFMDWLSEHTVYNHTHGELPTYPPQLMTAAQHEANRED